MEVLSRLNKPEYFYRPAQLLKVIATLFTRKTEVIVTLPWGLRLAVNPRETIGHAIFQLGVYDLCVSESINRLLDPAENAIDVGANLGYMTSLMVAKVGRSGSVLSFEPHPELYCKLKRNAERWRADGICVLRIVPTAMSSRDGFATLNVPVNFKDNAGLASLESNADAKGVVVPTQRLDAAVTTNRIALMKIDVEGHELQVLLGAGGLVTNRRIRDILFEEEGTYPTAVTDYLENQGYKIYELEMKFRGPSIVEAHPINGVQRREWEPKSFLATCAKDRAENRFRSKGWTVLQRRAV